MRSLFKLNLTTPSRILRLRNTTYTSNILKRFQSNGAISNLSEGEKIIYDKLVKAFEPSSIEVTDVSGGCGSMYAIEIKSDKFKGLGLVKQQRLVNEVLKDDIQGMHGLQLKTSS